MSSRELSEYMAYEQIEGPIGARRGDFHAAMVSAHVVNSQRGKKPPVPLKKFLPEWDRAEQDPEDMFAIARQLNAMLGGVEVDGGGEIRG